MIKAKKKIAEENIQNAVKVATETAEVASSNGKSFCIAHVNVGADTSALREAVVDVMEKKVIECSLLIIFSVTFVWMLDFLQHAFCAHSFRLLCFGLIGNGNYGLQRR